MLKNKKNKTIKELLDEKKTEENIRQDLLNKNQINEDTTIVVEKKSKIISFLLFIIEVIKIVLRLAVVVSVCILTTIGGTVLINNELREYFLSVIKYIL